MITCGAKNWSQLRIPNPSGQFAQRLLADSDVPTYAYAGAYGYAYGYAYAGYAMPAIYNNNNNNNRVYFVL